MSQVLWTRRRSGAHALQIKPQPMSPNLKARFNRGHVPLDSNEGTSPILHVDFWIIVLTQLKRLKF